MMFTSEIVAVCRGAAAVSGVIGSAVLAFNGIEGWGWFLFAAVCMVPSYKGIQ